MKPDKNRALIGFNVLEKLVFSKNFFFPSRRIAVRSLKRFKNIFKYYDLFWRHELRLYYYRNVTVH